MAAVLAMSVPAQQSPTSLGSRRHSDLSLDFSDIPALSQPSPPSNTLLITNLQAPEIFASANLESIHRAVQEHAPIYSFSPLKSMRRIICTFYSVDDATTIRKALDGETVLGSRVRVYFGAETKIDLTDEERHLQAPKAQKQFFISPPPSPPMGWNMRNEDPPNKEVHAEDLASALSKLNARGGPADAIMTDSAIEAANRTQGPDASQNVAGRVRSATGSFVVYDPQHHGHSPDLPAIAVEDTSVSPGDLSPMEGVDKKFVHTARPPVELMES